MPSGSRRHQPFLLHVSLRIDAIDAPNAYPYNIPAIGQMGKVPFGEQVTFFVGENGTGKSTLLEAIAIACGFNPEGGTTNFRFNTRSSESALHRTLRLARGARRPRTGFFLRAESFFNVATEIENLDREPARSPPVITSYGGTSLHEQSHGESFFALVRNRFGKDGLYLLDEPESALSPHRQLALVRLIRDRCLTGSQFVIATHSPILLAFPDALIYELTDRGVSRAEYDALEHVTFTRAFMADRHQFLRHVLADDE